MFSSILVTMTLRISGAYREELENMTTDAIDDQETFIVIKILQTKIKLSAKLNC